MFGIGDKIFYPMHGAGEITGIEEKEVLGKTQEYCMIEIPASNLDVMIPMGKLKDSGIRLLVDRETIKEILYNFQNVDSNCNLPWKERYRKNTEKMKTGQFRDGAEVLRDLLHREREKPLNSSEKQMLNEAKKILVSELALIKDISEGQAADMLTLSWEA